MLTYSWSADRSVKIWCWLHVPIAVGKPFFLCQSSVTPFVGQTKLSLRFIEFEVHPTVSLVELDQITWQAGHPHT